MSKGFAGMRVEVPRLQGPKRIQCGGPAPEGVERVK